MDSLYTDTLRDSINITVNDTIDFTQKIFGSESIEQTSNLFSNPSAPTLLSDCLTIKIFTIILFLIYAYFIYYYKGYILACISAIFRPKILDKLMEEQNHIFETFMKFSIACGLSTIAFTTLKLFEISFPTITLDQSLNISTTTLAYTIILAIATIYIFKTVAIYIVGKLTHSDGLMVSLIRYLNLNLITTTLILTPLYIVLYQSFGIWQTIILYLIAITLILMSILLFFNSYLLFIKQKVSILYWFLYLCAIEFLPLSLVILLGCKNL